MTSKGSWVGGKGDSPRTVKQEAYSANHERIFGETTKEPEPTERQKRLAIVSECLKELNISPLLNTRQIAEVLLIKTQQGLIPSEEKYYILMESFFPRSDRRDDE